MKTRLLVLFFSAIFFTSQGQTIFLKFGPSFSKVTWTTYLINQNDVETKTIVGVDFLAGINYLNFKYFYLSSGIGYIQKGSTENVSFDSYEFFRNWTQTATTRLHYATINTTFNVRYPIKNFIEPYISVGPRFDYLFAQSQKGEVDQKPKRPDLNTISYGLLFGGGINFSVKRILFGIDFDYYFDLTDVVDKKSASTNGQTYTYYNSTFAINLLIGLKL
jgi:hypothetical protein